MSRIVLVTGGAAGIGWATARRFATMGERVVIADIDLAAAQARADTLGEGHAAMHADIGAEETASALVAAVIARFGRLDVLINNAGVIDSGGTQIVDQPIEALQRLLSINLLGMERMSRAAHAVMRTQSPLAEGGPRGVIVNLASGAAFRAIPLRNGYSASKAGVVAMTRSFGGTWAREGVRVNALAPGYILTDLVADLIQRGRVDPSLAVRRIPLGRMGTPEEMADCAAFLASSSAEGMVGGVLIADGGGSSFGGSDDAHIQRGAPPVAPPDGTPVYAVAGIETPLGDACARGLRARGFTVVDIAAAERLGRLDGLVNATGTDGLLDPQADSATQLERHLEAQMRAGQVAGRRMLVQGFGAVVNLTASSGLAAGLGPHGGAVASAAIGMLTRSMACEWGGSGVRANALCIGPLAGDRLWRRMPGGQAISPDAVAGAVAFLLSPAAGYITGSIIAMDGGAAHYAGPDMEEPA